MRYKITSDERMLHNHGIVLMYFIMGMPFTFDEIDNPSFELIEECEEKTKYTMDDLYHISQYLIMEECHPILFEMSA